MKVKDLRAALVGVSDDAVVVLQGNVPNDEETEGTGDPSYTICTGHLFSAFARKEDVISKNGTGEFVLDCAITNSEGGILS